MCVCVCAMWVHRGGGGGTVISGWHMPWLSGRISEAR